MMDTGALLGGGHRQGQRSPPAEAAIKLQQRGPDVTKRIFDGDWQQVPQATTENFLRDVFYTRRRLRIIWSMSLRKGP